MKILILFFSPEGRDPEAMIPLGWLLKNKFKHDVKYGSIFDSTYLIDRHLPDLLLLNNIGGSEFNVRAADYAYSKGVRIISLTSEGLFRSNDMQNFIWGNNKSYKVNWHKKMVWSNKFLKMSRDFLPSCKNTFDISGSTGIDRYKIYKFLEKKVFLKKYKKTKYKKIITYAGYSFGYFYNQKWLCRHETPIERINFFKNEFRKTKEILLSLIKNNPDILFILKKHPAEDRLDMEIDSNWKFSNVLIFQDEEKISDLINVGDLYVIYESTSAFEAYALNKTVLNIFPSSKSKLRYGSHLGNKLIKNSKSAQEAINEFYKTGRIKEFDRKNSIRKKIIQDSVGSIDGLNSLRAAIKIHKFIKNKKLKINKKKSLLGLIFHLAISFGKKFYYLPVLNNSSILKEYRGFYKFFDLSNKYESHLRRFYA